MSLTRSLAAGALLAALGLAPGRALAAEGVVEINQAGVAGAGGFPFVIARSGSYRLTSDLVIASVNADVLRISADHVTLDLNGFAIRGPVVCAGQPLACALASSGRGVSARDRVNLSVANGSVSGMGTGVDLGADSRIENVRATSNEDGGLSAGRGSRVSGCAASENGGYGIKVAEGSVVLGNTARGNAGDGFELSLPQLVLQQGRGSVLVGNAATGNGQDGFDLEPETDGIVLVGNSARLNGWEGIDAGNAVVIAENDAADNGRSGIVAGMGSLVVGNAARSNSEDGVLVEAGSRVVGNVLRENDEGLVMIGGLSGYAENELTANRTNDVVGLATNVGLGSNLCGAALCP